MKDTATLLISCPDRKGIVAAVSDLLYKNEANIIHADQHLESESNLFLMRVEWDLSGFTVSIDEFKSQFVRLAEKFEMTWKIALTKEKIKMAIFVSKETHCLADLLYRNQIGELNCEVPLIISNHLAAKKMAEFYQIPFHHIEINDKQVAETQIQELLKKNEINLIVLARYMQILSDEMTAMYPNQIINIHHSFLPAFIGAKPYHQALERGVKIIGATSHYVTAALDQGPIIEQDVIKISHRDTVADLIQKGRDLEKVVLSRAVKLHVDNRILTYGNKTVIF